MHSARDLCFVGRQKNTQHSAFTLRVSSYVGQFGIWKVTALQLEITGARFLCVGEPLLSGISADQMLMSGC